MSRKSKLILNTVFSVFNQIVSIISGLILPRNYLLYFGSELNGLISSITQFLGFISFMQLGIGAVIQASWYKALNERDDDQISQVYVSAEKFFRKLALIFVAYAFVLAIIYPYFIGMQNNRTFVSFLVVVLSIGTFAQYFWGITNALLLQSDQKGYIPQVVSSGVSILNVIISVLLMKFGFSILIVKTISTIISLINPIILAAYVKKKYNINKKISYDKEPIKNKWSGFAQHISAVIVDNTDIVVLTLFSELSNVSVYSVYHMVVNGIRLFLASITGGIQSLFGNMIAQEEQTLLKKTFSYFELCFNFITTLFYSTTVCLIVPFVQVYTHGIDDVNYIEPFFAIVLSLAYASHCYRTIYYTLIKAAGHFLETQNGAIIEAIINIFVSVILVTKLGLVGVAFGTLIAMLYRTLYCVWYLSKNIIYIKVKLFFKNAFLNALLFLACYVLTYRFSLENISYYSWIILAIKDFLICLGICVAGYFFLYRKQIIEIKGFVKKINAERRESGFNNN